MRTSLTETAQIESWLLQREGFSNHCEMEAKILSDPDLKEKVKLQSATYQVVKHYGREILKKEIREVEHRLFHDPGFKSFQLRIQSIFKR